jgi:hypothetical protein
LGSAGCCCAGIAGICTAVDESGCGASNTTAGSSETWRCAVPPGAGAAGPATEAAATCDAARTRPAASSGALVRATGNNPASKGEAAKYPKAAFSPVPASA